MQIKEVTKTEEVLATFNIAQLKYPDLTKDAYLKIISNLTNSKGHQMLAAIKNDLCIGLLSFFIITKLNNKKTLHLEDFITINDENTSEIGKEFIKWLENKAKSLNCQELEISLSTKDLAAHKTFSQEKFILDGFYFKKQV